MNMAVNTALRPMSTGEVLDRTFNLYRRNFMLFFGIALLPPALMLIVQLMPLGAVPLDRAGSALAGSAAVAAGIGVAVFAIFWFVGYAFSQAATVFAVSAVHLGRQTSIKESYARLRGRYLRVLGLVLLTFILVALAMIVIMAGGISLTTVLAPVIRSAGPIGGIIAGLFSFSMVIAGFVVGILLFLRFAVAVPACVLEDMRIIASLKRSTFLTRKDRGRIFVIFFLVGLLNYALMWALVLPAALLGQAIAGEASVVSAVLNAIAMFLASAFIGPIATIAMSLVYYDERVRKEAFDLQLMMSAIDKPAATAASATA